ncbi:MAG: tryptophan synthase subunit alpha [Actinobacteria bacterium]|nr:MAG: tryptophan synthase subunit alpha [Actinomycetota bacterium]
MTTTRKTLVIYLMAGRETPALAEAAVGGGADIVELGFPFSDPLADGPVIRRAGERALAEGMRTRACLDCLARTRALLPDTPLIPMTYASLLEAYGWERFADDARAAGATSLIVADLPAGERPELRRVQLVAPTSTDERIRLAAHETDGWLYLVTLTGTTGARDDVSPALAGLVAPKTDPRRSGRTSHRCGRRSTRVIPRSGDERDGRPAETELRTCSPLAPPCRSRRWTRVPRPLRRRWNAASHPRRGLRRGKS